MMGDVPTAALSILSYFHVFDYPLSSGEVWKYMCCKCEREEADAALKQLADAGVIWRIGEYYSIENNIYLKQRREEGTRLGKQKLKKALRISRWLGLFPFVEAVCVSGSLSKDFALPDSDLDFFIITAPGRLWTARNFMHLFRKFTFLFGAQDLFCMNYYISRSDLGITPQNIYTAIELYTLKTGWACGSINEMMTVNSEWVAKYLPNMYMPEHVALNKKSLFTRLLEWLLETIGGDKIEELLYKTTMKRWARKWGKMGYDVEECMRSAGLHINTPVNYPENLPERVLQQHADIYKGVCARYKSLMAVRA